MPVDVHGGLTGAMLDGVPVVRPGPRISVRDRFVVQLREECEGASDVAGMDEEIDVTRDSQSAIPVECYG